MTTELCEEVLRAEESDIRPFSDDQNIVVGYACGDERTNYLPVAHWISGELGRCLFARLRSDADLSRTFGPDFKILSSLSVAPGATRVEWDRLILSVQHLPKLPYERQHRLLLPLLEKILRELEAEGLRERLRRSPLTNLSSMGQESSLSAARLGITGFREKSSLSITTVRACRSAAGRSAARIPTRLTSAARCGPANWPRNSLAEESMKLA